MTAPDSTIYTTIERGCKMKGDPRMQYHRVYVLLPQDLDIEWYNAVLWAYYDISRAPTFYTLGASADDAAVGNLDKRTILAVNPALWGPGDHGRGLRGFYEDHYGLGVESGLVYKEIIADTPKMLKSILRGDAYEWDAPVGTAEERAGDLWPGHWFDANPYGTLYANAFTGRRSYHTGADLNLNQPHWDADRDSPVYAPANGIVTANADYVVWGRIIILQHEIPTEGLVYTRYAHVADVQVEKGMKVKKGQQIARVGQDALGGPFHLHFDISLTTVLQQNPDDWPGMDFDRLHVNYVDPLLYISTYRKRARGLPLLRGR